MRSKAGPVPSSECMKALFTATIYFGTFLTIGWLAKVALDRWTKDRGMTPSDTIPPGGSHSRFLLGAWWKGK
jgi:hypothetical protein